MLKKYLEVGLGHYLNESGEGERVVTRNSEVSELSDSEVTGSLRSETEVQEHVWGKTLGMC